MTDAKNSEDNSPIWDAVSFNESMQATEFKMGDNIKVTNTYSHNYLTGTEAIVNGTTVHSMGFTWDYAKGNLSNRNNNTTDLQEHFTYDAMQRCTTATSTSSATANINTSYDNNGNITGKSDVGDYEYNGSQPHAVTDINNFVAGSFPQADQNITYNKLNKVATITEDINSMEFVYGVSSERRKATFKQNTNDVQWTRYYAAAYEITFFTDNHIRDMHYINGPDGLCAIYVRNSKATQDSLYFVFKDHLGSLTTITDKNGSVLQQLNYNLWGKRSVEAGSVYASPLFDRGFTGHEHLDMFGLINMNGRVYDPLLGRFLSPDKYVQGTGTQGFNRYTYCRNNPLKYTDPSGNVFGWYGGSEPLREWFEAYWVRQMSRSSSYAEPNVLGTPGSHRRSLFDNFTELNMSEVFGTPEYITVHGSDFTDYWNSYRTENETRNSKYSVEAGPLSAPDYNPDEESNEGVDGPLGQNSLPNVYTRGVNFFDIVNGIPVQYSRTFNNTGDRLELNERKFYNDPMNSIYNIANGVQNLTINNVILRKEENIFSPRANIDPNRLYFQYGILVGSNVQQYWGSINSNGHNWDDFLSLDLGH